MRRKEETPLPDPRGAEVGKKHGGEANAKRRRGAQKLTGGHFANAGMTHRAIREGMRSEPSEGSEKSFPIWNLPSIHDLFAGHSRRHFRGGALSCRSTFFKNDEPVLSVPAVFVHYSLYTVSERR